MKTAGEFGLDVTGVDISPVAVEQARQYGLALVGPMTDLPFADGEFDAAISWGVFYYSDRREMAAAFDEMRRILRPGGVALVNVRTAGDWRTHFIKDGVFRKEGEPEDGMPITFLTFHDLQQLLAGWSQMSADLAEWTRLNRTYLNSDWMLQVMR
jgi:SAM-dependent methyltransferase